MEESKMLYQRIVNLLEQMHSALDNHRWVLVPSLHQELMTCFTQYAAQESNTEKLTGLKALLREGFSELILRQQQRGEELQRKMTALREQEESVLAYSTIHLMTEST